MAWLKFQNNIIFIFIFILLIGCDNRPNRSQLEIKSLVFVHEKLLDYNDKNFNLYDYLEESTNKAFNYYGNEFDVNFIQDNFVTFNLDNLDELLSETYIDSRTILIKIFDGEGYNSGRSNISVKPPQINLYLSPTSDRTFESLLIHEIAHIFCAIDLKDSNHIMNEDSFLEIIDHESPNSIKALNHYPEFHPINKNIVNIATKQFISAGKILNVFEFDSPFYSEVVKNYEGLLENASEPITTIFRIAGFYFKEGKLENALNWYKKGIIYYSSDFEENATFHVDEFYYKIAICLINLNKINDAIEYLNLLSDEGPYADKKYGLLASFYIKSGFSTKAINLLREGLLIDKTNTSLLKLLGISLFSNSKIDDWNSKDMIEAKNSFELAFENGLKDDDIILYLAIINAGQGEIEKAKQILTDKQHLFDSTVLKDDKLIIIDKNYNLQYINQ